MDHSLSISTVLLALVIVLTLAKLGGHIALLFKQPEVLGELVAGIILGNLHLLGVERFEYLKHDKFLTILGELGVIILLFEVGLETTVSQMRKVGLSSLLVAVLGVIAPMGLGWFVSEQFAPNSDPLVHLFVGATLCATSVGITARVLKDIGKIQTGEAKIILGAAVIDDVLGLIILAVLTGMVSAVNSGSSLALSSIGSIIFFSLLFFVLAIVLGKRLSPFFFRTFSLLRSEGLLITAVLIFCFGVAYFGQLFGLAPIVGAFTAGLILEEAHYKSLLREGEVEDILKPIASFFVPIFFVHMGTAVDLSVLFDFKILFMALVLTVAAIIGKQACSLGVIDKGIDRLSVGLGMVPRGEVGLIFAGIGAGLTVHGERLISSSTFSAVVIVVIFTTMITPPALAWRFNRVGSID